MYLSYIALGLGTGTIFLIKSVIIYRIIQNFSKDQETALTKLFLKEEVKRSFKLLAAYYVILAVILGIEIIGFLTENPQMQIIARTTAFIPMLVTLYFYQTIKSATQPVQKE